MSYRRRRYYKRNYSSSDLSSIFKIFFYIFAIPFILIYLLIKLIVKSVESKKIEKEELETIKQPTYQSTNDTDYSSKTLVTDYERYFLDVIERNYKNNYRIIPQVPLSSIVKKHKEFEKQYQNELYRTIDIGLFDIETFEPVLMIEINDKTHEQAVRYKRDLKVREILNKADIPLLTFYSGYSNNEDYIVNRISDFLKSKTKV